ncbi:unnamed protein product [marine sediment metagenome]|uniref:Uncharacterized protein n=1 Tax=marine sediment metagenome TaxID=412755 RepID=X1VBU3_9ZZZZ
MIAVPRQKRFHEVNDDHQVEFARAMSQRGLVTAVYEIDELETALEKVSFVRIPPQRDTRLIGFLDDYISQLAQARHMKDGK